MRVPWEDVFVDDGDTWRAKVVVRIGNFGMVTPTSRIAHDVKKGFLDFDAHAGHDLEVQQEGLGFQIIKVY